MTMAADMVDLALCEPQPQHEHAGDGSDKDQSE
jgi:hypothetical protein